MARRYAGQARYLGNRNKNQVHDLDQENTDANGCQIDEIRVLHAEPFESLADAYRAGYESCDKCLGDDHRRLILAKLKAFMPSWFSSTDQETR